MSEDELVVWHTESHLHPESSPYCCPCATWRGVRLACVIDVNAIEMRLWSVKDATGKVIAEGRCNRWSVKSMMLTEAAKALEREVL